MITVPQGKSLDLHTNLSDSKAFLLSAIRMASEANEIMRDIGG